MDLYTHCIRITKRSLTKQYFYIIDILDDYDESLFLKTAKDNGVNVKIYMITGIGIHETDTLCYKYQRLIFSMKINETSDLPIILEKFHNNMILRGYIDFDELSQREITDCVNYTREKN
jgi:hypothetical protein